MNPRDYQTWTTFADHPVFSDRRETIAEWSSDPAAYQVSGHFPRKFDAEWYVHVDPRLPADVQAAHAACDIRSLINFCAALNCEFGQFDHELFILDDFTVYVRISHSKFTLELSAHDNGDHNENLTIYVVEPFDDELVVDTVETGIAQLTTRLDNA